MKIKTFIKLGDICDISAGQGAPQGDSNYCDNGTPFVKAGNLIELLQGKNETDIQKVSEDVAKKHKLKKYTAGSILFAKSGMSCMKGYVYQLKNDSYVVSHLAIVKPIKDSSDYIEYCLRHIKPNSLVKDEAYPSISLQDISNLKIPLPSLEEQIKISKQLYICTQIINKHKKQLERYDTLIKSRFIEMFGAPDQNPLNWEISNLGNFIENANNGMARRGNDKNGKIVLRLVELQRGFINYSDCNRIAIKTNEEKYLLKNNDFLFARVNGNPDNVGRCSYYKDIGEEVYHNDHIIRVHFDENRLNEYYLNTLLNSEYGKSEFKKYIKTSAGQYTIAQDGISSAQIPIPPIELQNDFASFVQQIDKSKFEIANSLKRLYNKWMLS